MCGTIQADWEPVGTPGFSAKVDSSLAFAVNDGIPYVAFEDNDHLKVTAMRYHNGSWETVGAAGFSIDRTLNIALAVDGNEPFVVYRGYFGKPAAAMHYTDSGGWQTVGAGSFPTSLSKPSLVFEGGEPYLAYMDPGSGNKVSLLHYTGGSWQAVGTPGFSANTVASVSLAFYAGEPYVAYMDGLGPHKATVMRYTGGSWQPVGTPDFTPGYASGCELVIDDSGTPYVGFSDGAQGGAASVMRYNGTAWEYVGPAGFTTNSASNFSLALKDGEPHVGFADGSNSSKATVMHFTDGSWQTLGTAGFSDGGLDNCQLVYDGGQLYFGFRDTANSQRASVYVFVGPPTVTTDVVSNVKVTTADAGGNVTSDGGATVTERGVCWSTTSPPTTADNTATDGTGAGSFTATLTGLSANTTYYVRAYAINKEGTSYGQEETFTTTSVIPPTVSTTAVSSITDTTAESGGDVTSDGGAAVTVRGVCWSTTSPPTTADNTVTSDSGTGSFTATLAELTADTTYYVRAYATNSAGTAYGETLSFTTQPNATDDPNSAEEVEPDITRAPQLAVSIRMSPEADDDSSADPNSNASNVAVGDEINVVVTIENTGTAAATGVTTMIPIPEGLEFIAAYRVSNDPAAQDAPLNATVVDNTVVLELDQVDIDESVDVDLQFAALAASEVVFKVNVHCDVTTTPITAQADAGVVVDDTYWEIRTTGMVPMLPCSLIGFASIIGLVGAIRLTRRVRK